MNAQRLLGQRVRLEALQAQADLDVMQKWTSHSAAWRLLDAVNTRWRGPKDNAPEAENRAQQFYFRIYPLSGDRPIGQTGLFGIDWPARLAWLGIGLADRALWDGGYGVDALQVLLGYGFNQLSLRRILVGVFDYDAHAILAYEQAGFAIEGRVLQEAGRAGLPRAGVYMGLRREDWTTVGAGRN